MNYFGIVDPFFEKGYDGSEALERTGVFVLCPQEDDEMATSFGVRHDGPGCLDYHGHPEGFFRIFDAEYSDLRETEREVKEDREVIFYSFRCGGAPYQIRDSLFPAPSKELGPDDYQWEFKVFFMGDNTVL